MFGESGWDNNLIKILFVIHFKHEITAVAQPAREGASTTVRYLDAML